MSTDLYEAATSDEPGNPRFPEYTRAPTDPGAAAPGSPFVNLVFERTTEAVVIRFWCKDVPDSSELEVDFEPIVESLRWNRGHVEASSEFVAALIVRIFFEEHCDHWYRKEGVKRLLFRDIRNGTVCTFDHATPIDAKCLP